MTKGQPWAGHHLGSRSPRHPSEGVGRLRGPGAGLGTKAPTTSATPGADGVRAHSRSLCGVRGWGLCSLTLLLPKMGKQGCFQPGSLDPTRPCPGVQ